ncbi:hypothetical protein M8542_14360 [Amycolatopsis sp. OK19-0408]|uniref:Uncharacterized protein n=1 Tax=Amycolatopsis iheyensis TaxID=2945988 RepID=A0A9X2N8K2_9PSEU|nr:hypothetical protein [Amycolatopsis iheyensis]MCR6484004.1 hypothetical protein [Amycolatopsis iheyensis]
MSDSEGANKPAQDNDSGVEKTTSFALRGAAGAVVVLAIGLVLQGAFGSKAAVCNSPLGQMGQLHGELSDTAACGGVVVGDQVGIAFTWAGAIGLGLLALILILAFATKDNSL